MEQNLQELDSFDLHSSDESKEDESSESSESLPDLSFLKPYDFEPTLKDFPMDFNDQDTEKVSRIGNLDWCNCGECQPMDSEAESLCCLDTNEVPDDYFEGQLLGLVLINLYYSLYTFLINEFILGNKCVTKSTGFQEVCLSKNVLKTVLSALNELRGDSITATNSSYRFAGYKQYTWWVHNRLGKGVRKVIPSCAIWAIRTAFPSENGNYIPFMESKEEEKRLMEI